MGLFNIFERKTPIENVSLQRIIPQIKKWKMDTVYISTSQNCPLCKKYNHKHYSLYGWNKKYPKLPEFLYQRKCPECDTCIGATLDVMHSK